MEDHQSQPERSGEDGWVQTGMWLAFALAVVGAVLLRAASIFLWLISLGISVYVVRMIRRSRLPEPGYAIAWMVVVFSSLALIVIGLGTSSLFGPRHSIHREYCSNNLHQLSLAINSYTGEHQNRYPDPDNWMQQTVVYVKTQGVYKCPKADFDDLRKYPVKLRNWAGPMVTTYAMNERLKGLSVGDVKKPDKTVLLFESNGEKLSGGPELLPKEMRHEEERTYLVVRHPYINVLFADLHVNRVPLEEVPHLKWDPK